MMARIGIILLGAGLTMAAHAVDWDAQLQGGGRVYVDPQTNRGTVIERGVAVPLWDGVHRLEDGSSITVRSGVVVPNAEILESRLQAPRRQQSTWQDTPIVGYSPCEKLVRTVCGAANECSPSAACSPAQQLLRMEAQERGAGSNRNLMTYTSGQCQEALQDREFFLPCGQVPLQAGLPPAAGSPAAGPTVAPLPACESLVHKVCGEHGECAGQPGCDPARQLLRLDLDEHQREGAPPGAVTETARQCQDALLDEHFFAPCGAAP